MAKQRQDSDERAYDRLEAEAEDFHQRVRESYQRLADAEPERFVILDGTDSIEAIHHQITQKVATLLS